MFPAMNQSLNYVECLELTKVLTNVHLRPRDDPFLPSGQLYVPQAFDFLVSVDASSLIMTQLKITRL